MEKTIQIKEFLAEHSDKYYTLPYAEIINSQSLNIIHDLLVNGVEHRGWDDTDGVVNLYYSIYYQYVKGRFNKLGSRQEREALSEIYNAMTTHYLAAIDRGNDMAMYYIGRYYLEMDKHDLMEKYYTMAIAKNNIHALYDLGRYYQCRVENKIPYRSVPAGCGEWKEEFDDSHGMTKLDYCQKCEEYAKMKQCYVTGAYLSSRSCIDELNEFLHAIFDVEFAIEVYSCLDNDNLIKLNRELCKMYRVMDSICENPWNYKAVSCLKCLECKRDGIICVYLSCGHPICFKCYGKICPLCEMVKE